MKNCGQTLCVWDEKCDGVRPHPTWIGPSKARFFAALRMTMEAALNALETISYSSCDVTFYFGSQPDYIGISATVKLRIG